MFFFFIQRVLKKCSAKFDSNFQSSEEISLLKSTHNKCFDQTKLLEKISNYSISSGKNTTLS